MWLKSESLKRGNASSQKSKKKERKVTERLEEMTVFQNDRFGKVRTFSKDGEPWFVGKDVAEILGYADPNKAIAMHVDEDDKLNDKTASSLGQRGGWLINESGLYSLILSSKLPAAKEFKRWITHDVIPTIRKTGGYVNNDELFIQTYLPNVGEEAQNLFRGMLSNIRNMNQKIEADKPKVLFADAVSTSKTSILVGELAKLIKQNGVEIGQNRLFKWLRDNGYLIRRNGTDFNMPTQYSMENGWFEIKESSVLCSDGSNRVTKTVKVTGKGQQYFINKFISDNR